MQGRAILTSVAVATVLAATPAVARQSHSTRLTVAGVGIVRVHPTLPLSNSSIARAIQVADKKAIGRAFRNARNHGRQDAKAAGLKLKRLISISDRGINQPSGPFGPDRYCREVRVPVGKPVQGQKPTFKRERRCYWPHFVAREITLTYSAT